MQTLAQTLTAGNTSGGTSIKMEGASFDLGDGTGSGGGTLNIDGGSIAGCNYAAIATVQASSTLTLYGGGNFPWGLLEGNLFAESNACTLSMNGGNIILGNGTGTGGGRLELDAATLDTGTLDGTTPSNQITPVDWWRINVDGSNYWIPLYQ